MHLFKNKKIRSCYDKTSNKRWFSVVDICALLRDCDYGTARNYWKWLKRKLQDNQLVSGCGITKGGIKYEYKQLQMQASDNKLRYTDVMDAREILELIRCFPSPKARAFKLWVASILKEEKKGVVLQIEECLGKAKDMNRCRVGNVLKTIARKEIDVSESPGNGVCLQPAA